MGATELANALKGTDEVEITVVGRTSGRKISHPVWFVQENERLYLLPVKGSDSAWYRNVQRTPAMTLAAGQARLEASARPITDPERVRRVAEEFRAKYGSDQVRKYYSKFDAAVEVPLR